MLLLHFGRMSDRGENATNIHRVSYVGMDIHSDRRLQNEKLDGDELGCILTRQDILLLA